MSPKGYRVPRQFGRFDTVNVNASNFETFQEQATLATDTIDARNFGGLDDVNVGATLEQVISNAIQYAASVGASRVYLPKSMEAYNAALVTFNNAVQIVTETQLNAPSGLITSSTVNAANYPRATKEASINAAIAAAAAQGKTAVYVPANMLPYDASQVTFNNAVQMTREGGFPAAAGFDVIAYGASGNHSADDYFAIQACLDALVPRLGGRVLFSFPGVNPNLNTNNAGGYKYSLPLWIKAQATELLGIGRGKQVGTPFLEPLNFVGTGLFNALPTAALPINSSLLYGAGNGNAFDFTTNAGNTQYINLRDCAAGDIHGLAAFCYETDFRIVGANVHNSALGQSQGVYLQSETVNPGAFRLYVDFGTGKLSCDLTLSGGVVTLREGTALTTDVKHHAGIDYDGSTVRLVRDGAVVASGAGSGTVVQKVPEDVTIGYAIQFAPEQSLDFQPDQVVQGWARISNASRYTGNYTPPAKPTSADGSTKILINFETNRGPATKVFTDVGVGWLVARISNKNWGTPELAIDNLRFNDVGLGPNGRDNTIAIHLLNPTFEPHFGRIQFNNTRVGIKHIEGGYMGRFEELELTLNGGGRYGVMIGGLSGIAQIDTLIFNGGGGRVSLFAGGNVVVGNLFVQTASNGSAPEQFCVLNSSVITGAPLILNNIGVATETGTSADFRGAIAITGNAQLTINGGVLEGGTGGSTAPPILCDSSSHTVTVVGTQFRKTGSQTEYIRSVGTPTANVVLINPERDTALPWSISALVALTLPGIGLAFSATPTFDCSKFCTFELGAMTANVTGLTVTNPSYGQRILMRFLQDGTGGRTVNVPANVKGMGTVSAAAGTRSQQWFEVASDLNLYASGPMMIGM